ncbi:MAG: HAMP domain-containing protein [Elusimicrobia bacterium]|nr:HAMP domain-containing protein [Candidatus Liberimonas magnetica]
MRKTIFFKIFSGYLLIALGLSVLVLFFSYGAIKQNYISTFTNELTDLCKVVNPQALAYIKSNNINGLDQYIKKLEVQTHKRITIIDLEGNVLADSEADPKTMSNHKTRPEVQQVLNGNNYNIGKSLRYSSTVKEKMLYIAMPIEYNGKIIGILRASTFLRDINVLINNVMTHIISVTGIVLLISLIIAFLFSKSMSVPIGRLKEASLKIASGNFGAKVTLKNNDELNDLAHIFNQMAEKLGFLFNDISNKKDELNTIINSITEVLFVIDSNDKIVIYNESFKKVVLNEEIDGRFYWEIFRAQGLKELIDKAKEYKKAVVDEIEISGKIYASSAVPLSNESNYIIVMHDITQVRNLENKKKEFVANVSHELRTPLTAIKGFAETLEDETSPEGRRYLDIIIKHSERLLSIVEDLLLLSQIEEKGFKLEVAKTDIKAIIESVIKMFEPKIKEKNITINLSAPGNVQSLTADQFKLEQMFVNLIDNAIKYTDKGNVDISVKQDNKLTTIIISDSGIGIPQEHMPYIFERFYVVDKSRSRKAGGTGLGLSIVKHIVMLHGGAVNFESALGIGTKITITLPNH